MWGNETVMTDFVRPCGDTLTPDDMIYSAGESLTTDHHFEQAGFIRLLR